MRGLMLPSPIGSLDRHEQCRAAGLPTVSVLCGGLGLAVYEGRRWGEKVGRPVIQLGNPRFESVLDAWVDHLAASRDLARGAMTWLAGHLGRSDSVAELASRVGRMTPSELTAMLDSALTDASPSNAERVCRWLLERGGRGEPMVGTGLAVRLGEAFTRSDGGDVRERVVAGLGEMIPRGSDPVLLLARDGNEIEPAVWVESASQSLARIAMRRPSLVSILAIEPSELDDYCRNAPESRAKALIRAGVVVVPSVGEAAISQRIASEVSGEAGRLGGSARQLANDGASEALVGFFLDAARAHSVPTPPVKGSDDPARSAAERFLFERLESLPATAGLFDLNTALDFRFGPSKAMEVDLLSSSLRLAVEVDGYYHFLNAEAYRRDRRKDLELQKRGFLIVRVLAEDVVVRLEEVLSLILDAVASRGGRNDRPRGEAS